MSNRPLPSSFDQDKEFYETNGLAKLWRRIKEEPLIPLGCILTCAALYKATRSIRSGNKEQTNRYFRARIYGQAFTLAAMVGGSYYYEKQRAEEKSRDEVVKARKATEKRDAWIKELEVRDQEDQELRARARKLSEKRRQAERGVSLAVLEQREAEKAAAQAKAAEASAKAEEAG